MCLDRRDRREFLSERDSVCTDGEGAADRVKSVEYPQSDEASSSVGEWMDWAACTGRGRTGNCTLDGPATSRRGSTFELDAMGSTMVAEVEVEVSVDGGPEGREEGCRCDCWPGKDSDERGDLEGASIDGWVSISCIWRSSSSVGESARNCNFDGIPVGSIFAAAGAWTSTVEYWGGEASIR